MNSKKKIYYLQLFNELIFIGDFARCSEIDIINCGWLFYEYLPILKMIKNYMEKNNMDVTYIDTLLNIIDINYTKVIKRRCENIGIILNIEITMFDEFIQNGLFDLIDETADNNKFYNVKPFILDTNITKKDEILAGGSYSSYIHMNVVQNILIKHNNIILTYIMHVYEILCNLQHYTSHNEKADICIKRQKYKKSFNQSILKLYKTHIDVLKHMKHYKKLHQNHNTIDELYEINKYIQVVLKNISYIVYQYDKKNKNLNKIVEYLIDIENIIDEHIMVKLKSYIEKQ